MAQTVHQGEDIVFKCVSRILGNDLVRAYGLNPCRIVGPAPTELPRVPLERRLDYLFRLDDGSLLHLEFQSAPTKLERFMVYDVLLCERDRRKVRTVVVYTGGITRAEDCLDYGCFVYKVKNVFMSAFDGDAARLTAASALRDRGRLSGRQRLDLIFSPLMRQKMAPGEAVLAALEVAAEIGDDDDQAFCQAAILGLGDKFLAGDLRKKIREALGMNRFVEMLLEEGLEKGLEKGLERGRAEGKAEGKAEDILLLLGNRFGQPAPALQEAVRREKQENRLTDLLLAAAGVGSLEEFEALLSEETKKGH